MSRTRVFSTRVSKGTSVLNNPWGPAANPLDVAFHVRIRSFSDLSTDESTPNLPRCDCRHRVQSAGQGFCNSLERFSHSNARRRGSDNQPLKVAVVATLVARSRQDATWASQKGVRRIIAIIRLTPRRSQDRNPTTA